MAISRARRRCKNYRSGDQRFRTIDVFVNNAGIFYTEPFTDFTTLLGGHSG
jgi:short-subunit dehydrogenase